MERTLLDSISIVCYTGPENVVLRWFWGQNHPKPHDSVLCMLWNWQWFCQPKRVMSLHNRQLHVSLPWWRLACEYQRLSKVPRTHAHQHVQNVRARRLAHSFARTPDSSHLRPAALSSSAFATSSPNPRHSDSIINVKIIIQEALKGTF